VLGYYFNARKSKNDKGLTNEEDCTIIYRNTSFMF